MRGKKDHSDRMRRFHSSVNRIPIPRDYISEQLSTHAELSALYDDAGISGISTQDRLDVNRISGSVEVTVTTRSPLVTGTQDSATKGEPAHARVLLDEHGDPFIPSTIVKGMLSQAYEQVTASRFRVFGDHSERLTYRADAARAANLEPVIIRRNENGYTGLRLQDPSGRAKAARLFTHAIKREVIDNLQRVTEITPNNSFQEIVNNFQNGDRITFAAERMGNEGHYWVTHVQLENGAWIRLQDSTGDFYPTPDPDKDMVYEGYLYFTTGTEELGAGKQLFSGSTHKPGKNNPGSPGKISEFVFFADNMTEVRIDRSVVEDFQTIIDSYAYDGKDNESGDVEHNRFARDVSKVSERTPGDAYDYLSLDEFLAFAETSGGEIVGLYPTQVGRRTYTKSPDALAQSGKVSPPKSHIEASAGDRLFGYTSSQDSLRGRLFVGHVTLSKEAISTKELDLKPLLSPKPSSARRFLTANKEFTQKDRISGAPRRTYYDEAQLLGGVTYPFMRPKLRDTQFPKSALNSNVGDASQDIGSSSAVNLHVDSWIETGFTMKFILRFVSLTRPEFAILKWLLDSKGLYIGNKEGSSGYLRMGTGKPLGLGIVQVDAVRDSWKAYIPEDNLSEFYMELTGCLGYSEDSDYVSFSYISERDWDFTEEERTAFFALPNVRAFRRVASGYGSKTEVRYMLRDENKVNNQTGSKTDRPKPGRGLAPRLLSLDEGWDKPLEIKDN